MKVRPWLATTATLALAALLRLPWLGAIPTPAGDEGNWAMLALRLSQGVRAHLSDDAGFVTAAFAWLIAGAFKLLGPSFAAARAVPVTATLAAMVAATRLCERRREGLAVALVMAVHPWSVLWSRTVSVPYALSFSLAVVGPLAWLDALRTGSPWRLLVASQLLGAAMHFSPLALVPMAACALWTLRHRIPWRHVPVALSGLVHVAPVASGMLLAARVGHQTSPLAPGSLTDRLTSMASMLLGDLAGTSTAAHFAGCSPWVARAGVAVALAMLACVLARSRASALARFAALHLAVACVALPALLAPGRAWSMPVIDADRYGFALVAPLALAVGALASERTRAWRLVAYACLAWLSCVTAGVALHFVRGGGGDLGLFVARGGGRYRGWQVPHERLALPDMIRDAVVAEARGEPAVVEYADYAFHALRFSLAVRGADAGITHAIGPHTPPTGALVFYVLWSDAAFAPTYKPRRVPAANRALRQSLARTFSGPRLVRTFTMVDGTPLCELWTARAR